MFTEKNTNLKGLNVQHRAQMEEKKSFLATLKQVPHFFVFRDYVKD